METSNNNQFLNTSSYTNSKMSKGAITGIVVGVIAFVLICSVLIILLLKNEQKNNNNEEERTDTNQKAN